MTSSLPAVALLAVIGCAGAHPGTAPSDSDPAPPSTPPSYQFGAKFEPPAGRVVHGMGQWVEYNPKYLGLLPAGKGPAAELMFISIADTFRPWDPVKLGIALAQIGAQGRIPLIDIGLRGNQPTKAQYDTLSDKFFGIDDEVVSGTKWDSRLNDLVQVLKSYHRPVLARIGGEFNGWWNGYHPYDFPKAFRKIVGLFRAAGVGNVAFVWCYEPAGAEDFDATDGAGHSKWYPGDDVVDWFSIDLYAKGDVSGPTSGHGLLTPYGRTIKFLEMAVARARPVVVAESSPSMYDLSNLVEGEAAWEEWFAPYFLLIATRSEIKWFHYVNYDWTKSTYYAAAGWKNNDLAANSVLAALYVAELSKPKYLHEGEVALLKDYTLYP